jgi:NAD(P)-dependent dehydrogenase (short-subunit alcohol dehydrogenase family)
MTDPRVCVVVGVGPGNGEAFARSFSAAGFAIALVARRRERIEMLAGELTHSRAYACDVTDPAEVTDTFTSIEREMGPIDTILYNAGKGVWGDLEKVGVTDFEDAWRTNTLGAFLVLRHVAPAMKERGRGNVVFVGATASRRGVASTAAFAPAKAAQRSLAESAARHLGPSGIHVSLIVVDGIVGGPETRIMFASRPDDQFIKPEAIAEIALSLTRQDRSAWSFEVEARPYNEKW